MVNRKHSVVVPGGRGGCIAVLALGIFTFCGSEADAAEIVHVPGYSVFNHVAMPEGVPSSWGDLMFSSDGNTAYFIGDAENIGGGVWTSSVNRDVDGNVTSFGSPATNLFYDDYIDTGLEYAPGSSTLFYRGYNPVGGARSIAQRQSDGTTEYKNIANYDGTNGGVAFAPGAYPNGGGLVSSSYDEQQIYYHAVADDGDGTYTVGDGVLFAEGFDAFAGLGDLEYISTGPLADTLLIADYSNSAVWYIEIDTTNGGPMGGTSPTIHPFLSDSPEAWGLAVDPVTDNIWVINYGDVPLVQIIEVVIPTGACCHEFDGTPWCEERHTESECTALDSGTYMGDGSSCCDGCATFSDGGACCGGLAGASCFVSDEAGCAAGKPGIFHGVGTTCDPADPDHCLAEPTLCFPPVPAVSEWGLIAMALLTLTAGTLVFARRRRHAAA